MSLKFIPRLSDLGPLETSDLFRADSMENSRRDETMNPTPWSLDDNPFVNYTMNQFTWGRRVITFYRHPADDFRGLRGTRTLMGR